MLSRFGCRILKYLGELGTWEEDGSRKEKERKHTREHTLQYCTQCRLSAALGTHKHTQRSHTKGQRAIEQESVPETMHQPRVFSSVCAGSRKQSSSACNPAAPCPHSTRKGCCSVKQSYDTVQGPLLCVIHTLYCSYLQPPCNPASTSHLFICWNSEEE